MPRLRILAGPSPAEAVPISANDGVAHDIKSPYFEGRVCVFIRYEDELSASKSSRPASRASRKSADSSTESVVPDTAARYFDSPERRSSTWSIQVEGRFLQPVSSDDVLFGNTFERPLKLPWGSGAALKFMNFIDPTLEHDLGGPKPWALSPLVSTMPYLAHAKLSPNAPLPAFPPATPLTDGCGSLIPESHQTKSRSPSPSSSTANASTRLFGSRPSSRASSPSPSASPIAPASNKRRAIFGSQAARKATTLGPEDVLISDFSYGFISFPSLTLKLPGGISFDCMKYWDKQPVTFMCCRRGADGKGPGDPFWCVMFEVLEDEQEEEEDASANVPHGAGAVDEVD